MATLVSDAELDLIYRPSLAPWRHRIVEICRNPGVPDGIAAPPGSPITVPDDLVFAINRDLRLTGRIAGFQWIETPDAQELEAQRVLASRYLLDGSTFEPMTPSS